MWRQRYCSGQRSTPFASKSPLSNTIVLPRDGKSTTNASFTITARHDGSSRITVIIDRNGNFVRHMDLNFELGGTSKIEVTSVGRPGWAVSSLDNQDISLNIIPMDNCCECMISNGSYMMNGYIQRSTYELANVVQQVRDSLRNVINPPQNDMPSMDFQTGIDITQNEQTRAIRIMARAGKQLFDGLFCYEASDPGIRAFGNWLKEFALAQNTMKFQVAADRLIIPWDLLYLGDVDDDTKLDWYHFLGMRYIVEMIPHKNNPPIAFSRELSSNPYLCVSININRTIDSIPFLHDKKCVQTQLDYWESLSKDGKIKFIMRDTEDEVINAFVSGHSDEQLMYFYCHASADPEAADTDTLMLKENHQIQLGDLKARAPITKVSLKGTPLVFINACESADISPAFYDGFVPYLIEKGARGVIGTQCPTPAIFAAKWAERFFDLFLEGDTLGETFLNLRREFLEKHGNPLGLLYAVHSAGSACIYPAVTAGANLS